MATTSTLFDDILPADEPGQDASTTAITLVQLPLSAGGRKKFMQQLQVELNGQFAQSTLAPVPKLESHALGHASTRYLRKKLGLQGTANDAAWCNKLVTWGADSVLILQIDAFKSLLDRRTNTFAEVAVDKVFLVPNANESIAKVTPSAAGAPAAGGLVVPAGAKIDWHLDARGANVINAWRKFLARNPDSTNLPWKDILVGRLDTGYIEHEALAWSVHASSTVLHARGQDYFATPRDTDPKDPWIESGNPGHGTRIDGAISGFDARDSSHPFYGASPGLQIIPYRVTDSVIADHVPHNINDAINQAVSDGCHIVTICLGALRGSGRVANAIDRAYQKGVIVVCAAGQGWPWVIYPGRFNRVMTVSGIGPGGAPWGSAACGKTVDWCAPADEIRRIKIKPNGSGGYETGLNAKADGEGTSYATAITSSIAAMWLAWHGVDALRSKYAGQEWMIPAAFKQLVKASCKKWSAGSEGSDGYGAGVIDAAALLNLPLPAAGSMAIEALASQPFDSSH